MQDGVPKALVAVTPKALVAVTPKALGGDPAYLGHDLFFFNVDTAKEQRQRASYVA